MSNLTDALIAAKLMGGGGSGGGSGLPEITSTETVTTFDEDVEIVEGGSSGVATQAFGVGETVTVSWAGTTYSCVTTEVSEGGQTAVVFGNLSIVSMGENTGEPFLFIQMEQGGVVGYEILSSAPGGTYHVTVSVGGTQTPPDGYVLGVDGGEWKAIPGEKLPSVTSDDNGDVLTVVDGAWSKAAPSGGSATVLYHSSGIKEAVTIAANAQGIVKVWPVIPDGQYVVLAAYVDGSSGLPLVLKYGDGLIENGDGILNCYFLNTSNSPVTLSSSATVRIAVLPVSELSHL